MKIAIAQLNPTTGALEANAEAVTRACAEAWDRGAQVCVSPARALTGLAPRELLAHPGFIQAYRAAEAALVAALPAGKQLIYDGLDAEGFPCLFVAAAGQPPQPLPAGADAGGVVELAGRRFWVSTDPQATCAEAVFGLICPGAASFSPDQAAAREATLCDHAARHQRVVVSAELVGGNDGRICAGGSLAVGPEGAVRTRLAAFAEDLAVIDLDALPPALPPPELPAIAQQRDALVLGLRDYFKKAGFETAVLGLSGGIDSALTAYLAVQALGPDHVIGVAMPSRYSSDHSVEDAQALAQLLGLRYHKLPIEGMHAASVEALRPVLGGAPAGLTDQNLQARLRGLSLMAVANHHRGLVLSTGNKSEAAVGYATLYGDTNGALCVIADLYKHEVYAMARLANADGPQIPQRSIDKPPSAELSPGQKDSDSLPDYDRLDAMLKLLIEQRLAPEQLAQATGASLDEAQRVVRMVHLNEFKRRQSPPTLELSSHPLSARVYPILHSFRG